MSKVVIILDPAHGKNSMGKMSPDGLHKEYIWSRQICNMLERRLLAEGISVEFTTRSEEEPGLTFRKDVANSLTGKRLLISLHNNAAGSGSAWMSARGVEIWTTKGKTQSDVYADIIMKQLQVDFPELKFRVDTTDGDLDKESNFTVLTGAGYSAVLLEWLFQDNKDDVKLLQDSTVNTRLVNSLVQAIKEINK